MSALQKAVDLLQQFEQFRGSPYHVTPEEAQKGIWTIGYGQTTINDRPVRADDRMDINTAVVLLKHKVACIEANIRAEAPETATDNQIAACVCLCYNIGQHAFDTSTLLKMWKNGEDPSDQFDVWVNQAGVTLPGLVRRRSAEKRLFLS
jgi:lysozyme